MGSGGGPGPGKGVAKSSDSSANLTDLTPLTQIAVGALNFDGAHGEDI